MHTLHYFLIYILFSSLDSLLEIVYLGISVISDISFPVYPRYIKKTMSWTSNPNSSKSCARAILWIEFIKSSTVVISVVELSHTNSKKYQMVVAYVHRIYDQN